MRAFYYLFILFNNLLSIHIHTCGEKFGGGLAPKPLMSAAYDYTNANIGNMIFTQICDIPPPVA